MSKRILAGILLLCCGAFAGETVIRNGTQVIEKENLTTTTTDGLALVNPTLATSGVPTQYAPLMRWRANAHDTDGNVNDTWDWASIAWTVNGNTTTSFWGLCSSKNGAVYGSAKMTLSNGGNLSCTGTFTASGQVSGTVFQASTQIVTAGTMTVSSSAGISTATHKFLWTNAMVTALGAVTSGDVTVCTLPAKCRVLSATIVINTAGTNMGGATLTAQLGTDATFSNYLNAGSALAAANTVYGDADAELAAAMLTKCAHLPSWTATTAVKVRFVTDGAGGKTLADVLTSTGTVYLCTEILP